jgi:hypothetical protein
MLGHLSLGSRMLAKVRPPQGPAGCRLNTFTSQDKTPIPAVLGAVGRGAWYMPTTATLSITASST